MTLDPYGSCPCGSGKKFKWCCQPIYAGIQHAYELYAGGQHETALRVIDDVVREHSGNPEAWGRKAELLFAEGRTEDAEDALQKAFDLNPNYPYGLLLRARFRYQEGELHGALLLARKAVDAYDPEARDHLADAYRMIFEIEFQRNRPVAGRAALQLVVRSQPADEEARAAFDQIFGDKSRLPLSARRDWTTAFRSPPAGIAGARKAAWDRARAAVGARLGDLARAYDALVREDPADAAALFNLGLSRAWLGDNKGALEALDRYLDLEADESAAAEAAALMEVLRLGQGMEEEGDYRTYSAGCRLRDFEALDSLVREWAETRRLIVIRTGQEQEQQGIFQALILELSGGGLVTVGRPAADAGRLGGYLTIIRDVVQLSSPLQEPFNRLREELRSRLQLGVGELDTKVGPASFQDVIAEALLFPIGGKDETAGQRVAEHTQHYYEDRWIHQPRRVLGSNTPVDAVGHTRLRKQLRGVINFIAECAAVTGIGYDFDRLRRKLGLLAGLAKPQAAGSVPADIAALGAAELAALPVEPLSEEQLEQAYQAAHRLDAQELTARFADALVARPPSAERPDRFPWYSFLIQKALKEGEYTGALDLVNAGEKADCEQNEGRRRNDYELRRGQVHVKQGDADGAQDVFQRLIERSPSNLRYRGQAAEAMMALKQGARALRFAEEGLAEARKANDRDSEQYLLELAAAARRQMG
jgi:tetratricopeptide (TPR) repeat protein